MHYETQRARPKSETFGYVRWYEVWFGIRNSLSGDIAWRHQATYIVKGTDDEADEATKEAARAAATAFRYARIFVCESHRILDTVDGG